MTSPRHAYVTRSLAYRASELAGDEGVRLAAVAETAAPDEGAGLSALFLERRIRHHLAMACDAEEPARICEHIVRATAYLKLFNYRHGCGNEPTPA